jgi:hypothetical protein
MSQPTHEDIMRKLEKHDSLLERISHHLEGDFGDKGLVGKVQDNSRKIGKLQKAFWTGSGVVALIVAILQMQDFK